MTTAPRPGAATSRPWSSLTDDISRGRRTLWLLILAGLVVLAMTTFFSQIFPLTTVIIPMLLGSLFLGPRELPWYIVALLVVVLIDLPRVPGLGVRSAVGVAITFLFALIILLTSFRRSRLGVGGLLGESMLVDLRDRIQRQGVLPALPRGWSADAELRSAGGTSFAGDFVVAHCHEGRRLDVVVVDVSGKGVQASTRALLLSGALGGLIAAVPADQLVPAANEYLLARDWEEGFATAAHLSLDLESGHFTVWTAGHPPPVHFTAGSGRWSLLESRGPVLGLMSDGEFVAASGTMRSGDAMMLYTDGLVETRKFDIGLGIDRLIGTAEQTLRGGYDGAARHLVEVLGSSDDDRALVLVHRV
ncbi:MAG: PP2C family protein-serine/threonine phosphatase [Nocardioides sp.]